MVDESMKETADRVARYQTGQRVEPVYATRTTNCCGCLESDFDVLRLPVLSFRCHVPGTAVITVLFGLEVVVFLLAVLYYLGLNILFRFDSICFPLFLSMFLSYLVLLNSVNSGN